MEYENLKHRQKKQQEVDADISPSVSTAQQLTNPTGSTNSTPRSTSYQMFYLADDQSLLRHVTSQGENTQPEEDGQATSAAMYFYPQRSKTSNKLPKVDEEGYAYASTVGMDTGRKLHSQPVSPVPSAPVLPSSLADRQVTPPSALSFDDKRSVSQTSDHVAHSHQPARKISDDVIRSQPKGHPAAKQRLSVGSGSVSSKPLIMKMLPLYLCMDDGKVYADYNATSIPTHHLVEFRELERKIQQSMNQKQIPSTPPVSCACCGSLHAHEPTNLDSHLVANITVRY